MNERKSWSGFAFVSNWQLEQFASVLWIDRDKSRVMRNAASPAFVSDVHADPWFVTGQPPTLFYTSTPFRGLDVLLQAFPVIRAAIPGTRLRVLSSMGVYQVRPEEDEYQNLYRLSQTVDGVEYVGSVGQSQLARELAGTAALAYPSTFAETSCIASIEAMALGAAVFITRLGALPETTGGLASITEFQPDHGQLANVLRQPPLTPLLKCRKIRPSRWRNANNELTSFGNIICGLTGHASGLAGYPKLSARVRQSVLSRNPQGSNSLANLSPVGYANGI